MKKSVLMLAGVLAVLVLSGCSSIMTGVSTYGREPVPHESIADRYFVKVYFGAYTASEKCSRPLFEDEANKLLQIHPEYKAWYLVPTAKKLEEFIKEHPEFAELHIIPAGHRKNPHDTAIPSAWVYEVQFVR